MDNRLQRRSQSGFALFFALVFLLMMTLVAVTAMRGTALELNMANNVANYEIAFETAESGRLAFSKITPDLARCKFRWPLGIRVGGSPVGSCVPGLCGIGDPDDPLGSYAANFPVEPRISIDNLANTYISNKPGENVDVPSTFVDEYEFNMASGTDADIAVVSLGSFREAAGDASTGRGYEKPEDSSSYYFEFASESDRGGAVAQTASHFRLLNRDAKADCQTNLSFGAAL